jgi:cobalt/nickel transport system ATP-binding protein
MTEVTNLSVKYDMSAAEYALKGVNLGTAENEKIAVIGANGAGKSTLLLAMCGVLSAASGEIRIEGVTLGKKTLKELRAKIGMLFQNPDDQLFMPALYDDIAFGLRNSSISEAETARRTDDIMSRLGIARLKGRMTHTLSGGEKRIAALAGVIVMEPSLILMDEPSSCLDPRARRNLIDILKGISSAMIIATHDLDFALDLCGRTVLLKEGEVFADAPSDSVLRNVELLEACGLELPLSVRGR